MSNYEDLFEWMDKEDPATDEEIKFLRENILLPITKEEIEEANKSHWEHIKDSKDEFDAEKWLIPQGVFPESHISFLRWSNGGCFERGERQFNPLFSPKEIREMLLAYEFPEYMIGAVPIGFDGGGVFYLYDMRNKPVNGEYPIYMAGSGALFWDDAVFVSNTFEDLIKEKSDPYP